MSSESLENLISQAKNGDKDAFGMLYNELYTPLFRFIKSRTRDHEKSVDICQDVFLRWYNSMDTYEIQMKPLSYLMMIGMRLIINDSSKKKSLFLDEKYEEIIADESITPSDILYDFNCDADKVKSLFENLSEAQQIVLTMRYVSDADTDTIAEALETTNVNIRQIESRALKKLKELYEEKHGKENVKQNLTNENK
jgi:RNA polymerase sigma-70 factor (ECF subfamily)